MTEKQKARQQVPGKDESSEILTECAACGTPIRAGEMSGSALLPIGFDFTGRIIGERLPVCAKCIRIANKGEAQAAIVQEAIRIRYDAERGAGQQESSTDGAHFHKGGFH